MTGEIPWTDADKDKLGGLLALGLSASKCALQFDNRSRNAIIGVIDRNSRLRGIRDVALGIKRADRPVRKRKPARSRLAHSFVPSLSKKQKPSMPVIQISAADYDAGSRRLRLMELQSGHCRFIVSGSGEHAVFCGHEVTNFSWCSHHANRCFQSVRS